MIWTTTSQSFIALGFLKLGYFIRFGSYSQSQDLVTFYRPGPSLKLLAQFHYQKHFFKSNLNTTKFYMIWTTTPQSFVALEFLKLGYFIRFVSYSQSQDLANPV